MTETPPLVAPVHPTRSLLVPVERARYTETGGRGILCLIDDRSVHVLGPAAIAVWDRLDGERTLASIHDELAGGHGSATLIETVEVARRLRAIGLVRDVAPAERGDGPAGARTDRDADHRADRDRDTDRRTDSDRDTDPPTDRDRDTNTNTDTDRDTGRDRADGAERTGAVRVHGWVAPGPVGPDGAPTTTLRLGVAPDPARGAPGSEAGPHPVEATDASAHDVPLVDATAVDGVLLVAGAPVARFEVDQTDHRLGREGSIAVLEHLVRAVAAEVLERPDGLDLLADLAERIPLADGEAQAVGEVDGR